MHDQQFQNAFFDAVSDMDGEQLVHFLLDHAGERQASDLFLHTDERSVEIAMRRLGTVERIGRVPPDRGRPLISHIKAMAGLDISEHRRPLDGRFERQQRFHLLRTGKQERYSLEHLHPG